MRTLPSRLISTTRSYVAGSARCSGPPAAMPALATTTSTRPKWSTTSAATVASRAPSVTSTVQARLPGQPAATAASSTGSSPSRATRAPRPVSSRASCAPTPRAAPVTTTTWPDERAAPGPSRPDLQAEQAGQVTGEQLGDLHRASCGPTPGTSTTASTWGRPATSARVSAGGVSRSAVPTSTVVGTVRAARPSRRSSVPRTRPQAARAAGRGGDELLGAAPDLLRVGGAAQGQVPDEPPGQRADRTEGQRRGRAPPGWPWRAAGPGHRRAAAAPRRGGRRTPVLASSAALAYRAHVAGPAARPRPRRTWRPCCARRRRPGRAGSTVASRTAARSSARVSARERTRRRGSAAAVAALVVGDDPDVGRQGRPHPRPRTGRCRSSRARGPGRDRRPGRTPRRRARSPSADSTVVGRLTTPPARRPGGGGRSRTRPGRSAAAPAGT